MDVTKNKFFGIADVNMLGFCRQARGARRKDRWEGWLDSNLGPCRHLTWHTHGAGTGTAHPTAPLWHVSTGSTALPMPAPGDRPHCKRVFPNSDVCHTAEQCWGAFYMNEENTQDRPSI